MSSDKPHLYCLPGWGSNARCFEPLGALLAPHFELRYIELPYANYREAQGLENLLDTLAAQIDRECTVLGWSLGGMLALRLAERMPETVTRVITIASNARFVATEQWPAAMAPSQFADFYARYQRNPQQTARRFEALQLKGTERPRPARRALEAASLVAEPELVNGAQALLHLLGELDNRELISHLGQAQLMLLGGNDALVPSQVVAALRSLNANLACRVVAEAGHALLLSHPADLASAIIDFCAVLDPHYQRDKRRVAQSFSRAAQHYEAHAGLQREVAGALLKWSRNDRQGRVLDLGCGTGFLRDYLRESGSVTAYIGLDISANMLACARAKALGLNESVCTQHWCQADIERLPIALDSVDTIVSSLAIQWCDCVFTLMREAFRCLRPGGEMLLASLGPQTLSELNAAWHTVDPDYVHINRFADAEQLLQASDVAGFELQCFAADIHTVPYDDVMDLMRALKGIGAHNVNAGSRRGLTGPKRLAALRQAFAREAGKFPARYEVYYLVLRKPNLN